MNENSYVYDWQEDKDRKKIVEAFGELGTTRIDSCNNSK
jgi:hypothetical protein